MSYLNTDVPELKGYDTGTVLGNIELLEARTETAMEAVLCELSELAEAIIRDASGDPDTVFSILLSLRGQQGEEEDPPLRNANLLYQSLPPLRGMTKHLGLHERLFLYHLILKKLPALPVWGDHREIPSLPSDAQGRIAYMAGSLANKAYMRFSDHIPGCRAAIFHSFADACEEVRSGLCQYCILPLESSSEGKLMGFFKLMLKYSLQIIAVCDVKVTGGVSEKVTRMGLLRLATGENKALLSPIVGDTPSDRYLELLHVTAVPSYSEIMAAADFCGLSLRRTDTIPTESAHFLRSKDPWNADIASTSTLPLFSGIWEVSSAHLEVFLLFLTLEAPENPMLGLYPSVS
ncbi:MAG: hypothetical protein J6D87_08180 [Clostridia bacterium]|nr:hypothetical protein [Clostridia bacterium]